MTKLLILSATILLTGGLSVAQSNLNDYMYKSTSLDVVTNPASIVMGESFVANPNNASSFLENPANLSPSGQLGLFYNYRSHDWMELTKNFNYSSVGFSTHTSWGMIGFNLSQFSTGTNSVNLYSDLNSKEINRTYQVSFAKPVIPNLLLGVSIKIFNHSMNGEVFQGNIESNNAYLIDLGLRYSIELGNSPGFQHELNLGSAIQNLGTEYKEKNTFFSNEYNEIRLPRYFKIGFAYILKLKNSSGSSDIEATLTGQYKNLLNPVSSETFDVDYWGTGLEVFIKNIFAARIGYIQLPEHWIFYERAKPIFRYGFGLVIPFDKLGIRIPLIASIDYSFIPINSNVLSAGESNSNSMLHAIGFTLRYKSLFL